MPLIKPGGKAADKPAKGDNSAGHLAGLSSAAADTRWSAARALAGRADAVPALAEALAAEDVPRVREAIMTALMRVGNEASVKVMLPYLAADDAGLRAAAVEALRGGIEALFDGGVRNLLDKDGDLQGVLLVGVRP